MASSRAMKVRVLINNIQPPMEWTHLERHFQPYEKDVEVYLSDPKEPHGVAIALFKSLEAAEKAVSEMNAKMFMGTRLLLEIFPHPECLGTPGCLCGQDDCRGRIRNPPPAPNNHQVGQSSGVSRHGRMRPNGYLQTGHYQQPGLLPTPPQFGGGYGFGFGQPFPSLFGQQQPAGYEWERQRYAQQSGGYQFGNHQFGMPQSQQRPEGYDGGHPQYGLLQNLRQAVNHFDRHQTPRHYVPPNQMRYEYDNLGFEHDEGAERQNAFPEVGRQYRNRESGRYGNGYMNPFP